MEREHAPQGEPEAVAATAEDSVDLDATHEVTQRGQSILELSRELTSASKMLLERLNVGR